MRRLTERLLPYTVLAGFVITAIVIVALLNNARTEGIDALEVAKAGEVEALAGNRNEELVNALNGVGFLSRQPFDFQPGSENDQAILDQFRSDDARTGFYLLDADGAILSGILLNGDPVGDAFEWPGWDEARSTPEYITGGGVILPATNDAYTTDRTAYAFALPIYNLETFSIQGAFVAEVDVSAESDVNGELAALQRNGSDEFILIDVNGIVIGAEDTSLLGDPLDTRFANLPEGIHRVDGKVAVAADIPRAGWRIIFRQDIGEFEDSLAQPIRQVGTLVVIVLFIVGGGVFLLLARRLRAAREEQERLRRLAETQEEFISIVSHELRTPVAGVLGFLQTCLDHWDEMPDTERQSTVRRAVVNARRLQALTRDVLDTQSIEAGRMAFVTDHADLRTEVTDSVEAARDLYTDHPLNLTLPDDPVPVDIDSDRLQQVLTNLIDNAVKNGPADIPISVSVAVSGSEATVTVADKGAGLEAGAIEKVFDKFVRGRGQTVSGTGLGLYISRRIIEAHNGRIWAESDPGEGATFHFTLPIGHGELEATDQTEPEPEPA